MVTLIKERFKAKSLAETDGKSIKIGYVRVTQEVKDIRQHYLKAVTDCRRSSMGKLVCDNWDILETL